MDQPEATSFDSAWANLRRQLPDALDLSAIECYEGFDKYSVIELSDLLDEKRFRIANGHEIIYFNILHALYIIAHAQAKTVNMLHIGKSESNISNLCFAISCKTPFRCRA